MGSGSGGRLEASDFIEMANIAVFWGHSCNSACYCMFQIQIHHCCSCWLKSLPG